MERNTRSLRLLSLLFPILDAPCLCYAGFQRALSFYTSALSFLDQRALARIVVPYVGAILSLW